MQETGREESDLPENGLGTVVVYLCMNMCMDMCMDMCINMCALHNIHVDTHADTHADTQCRWGMCGEWTGRCGRVPVYRHVHTHVYRRGHGHVYTHAYGVYLCA